MYLYDTNVLSEFRKKQLHPQFKIFLATVQARNEQTFISSLSVGEIIKGIELLKLRNDFSQAEHIQNWFENDLQNFIQTAIPFDNPCAETWGLLMARTGSHNIVDKQLAATAIVHDLILVTRNTKDIATTGVRFINPFE